jgi:4a-hydroxytetrahydrobiopterin dehydratase
MAQTGLSGLMMEQHLAEKHCIPCRAGTPCLKGQPLLDLHQQLSPGWQLIEEQRLEKTYPFKNFQDALAFCDHSGDLRGPSI